MKKIFYFLPILICYCGSLNAQQSDIGVFGNWTLTGASETALKNIPLNQAPELDFASGNKLSGFSGCNQLSGQYTVEGNNLSFGLIIMTKKACKNMQVETIFEQFLKNAGTFSVDKGKLTIYVKDDKSKFLLFNRKRFVNTTSSNN